jgi:prepilin-type N-terminal cleavage/methylation domain-containing protein
MQLRRAFTLLELLVAIGIMGIMGTAAVGGYRAMRRGMEERSVMQNVNQLIRAAYQRAQIDRQPTAVFFWNETVQEESENDILYVVGKAVAVRRVGRLSMVDGNGNGSYLYDEYSDLKYHHLVLDEDDGTEMTEDQIVNQPGVRFYRMNGDEGSKPLYSLICQNTVRKELSEPLLQSAADGTFEAYAFIVKDSNGVTWKVGDAYGQAFAEIQLPRNYIFGTDYSRSTSSPVKGEDVLRFAVSANSGSGATGGLSGRDSIGIYSLRPGSSGSLDAQVVGQTEKPTKKLW